ncbi:MAG: nuclear transport factor 2 family protein [Hyphomonadaceae bacterium]
MNAELAERIERLESIHAIQQLAVRYAIAIDSRDLDAWLALFPDDIDCGKRGRGREALRGFIAPLLRDFYRTVHLICGHQIELVDRETATGRVYCRAEHERGEEWIVQAICYFDQYVRRDGAWYFNRREEDFWYSADLLERPQQAAFSHWPGPAPRFQPKMMVSRVPTWRAFWAEGSADDLGQITGQPGPT